MSGPARKRQARKRREAAPAAAGEPEYRVFVSYSHSDLPLVRQIVRILRANGIDPMWDEAFAYGHGFHEQIRSFIAHAHVFLPVLTRTASARNWVHQEIGYAAALNVPVLPVAIGSLPGQMIDRIHAIRLAQGGTRASPPQALSAADLALLRRELTPGNFAALIERHTDPRAALYTCAAVPDDRNVMLARHARDVLELGRSGMVRQKGGLSSFHIPKETIGHCAWKIRYGRLKRSEEHCRLQREERLVLTKHADEKGCRLILNPYLKFRPYGRHARLARLAAIRDFLKEMPDARCEVALHGGMDTGASVTIVGNWFAAEAVLAVAGRGYYQTIFTRHAPTVKQKVEAFDDEFHELLKQQGVRQRDSRRQALKVIEAEMKKLERQAEQSPKLQRKPAPNARSAA